MEKKLYWLVESNSDLSVTTSRIEDCQTLIENDFKENSDGYDVEDFQYTITPLMLTQEEYDNLPKD